MAAPGKPGASRWGSFLSQAVAGVESRLDNMLAEGEEQQQQQQPQTQAPMSAAVKPSSTTSRSSSNTRANANDRLQQRLAKAMAAKKAQGGGADTGVITSPRSSVDTARSSMDRPTADTLSGDKKGEPTTTNTFESTSTETESVVPVAAQNEPSTVEAKSTDDSTSGTTSQAQPEVTTSAKTADDAPSATRQIDISDLSKDIEEIKVRQQEEIQEYVERIDSLQSKLHYLSKSAAESAKKTASAAPSGSIERKLAEKDEKIALLMDEGQKLSAAEQKFRTTIKKLRQQMLDDKKEADELKRAKGKALIDAEALRNRLNGSEEKEKREEEARKATAASQKEIDALKKEKMAKDDAMRRLEHDLKAKAEKAEASSKDAHNKAMTAELAKQKQLEDIIAILRAEKESISDSARLERVEWSEKLERAQQRTQSMEDEVKHELHAMESKLEAMRSVAEEASSGSTGESQIKLIRQVETLQSQYASASSNWQGIEASLLAKLSNLEKERDEAQRRESEMRKKARDAASRCRRLEDEMQDIQPTLANTKQELETCRGELNTLRKSSKATETALEQARADLEKQQRTAPREFPGDHERFEEPQSYSLRTMSRPDSPLLSVPRNFSGDLAGFQIPGRSRRGPFSGSIPDSQGLAAEGLSISVSRRLSSQPGRPSALSPGNSLPPTPFSPFEPPSEMNIRSPSIAEREDTEDRHSSPRNVANDMISVSTVGAGPSVQLVERMSAAIRRLEGEKVAAREEMTRVCSQRDEARSDMVGLMKDVEASKASTVKVMELERQVEELNARYQTTLELLGEKSELVEELKADVQDVKAMYRELIERTIK